MSNNVKHFQASYFFISKYFCFVKFIRVKLKLHLPSQSFHKSKKNTRNKRSSRVTKRENA